MTAPDPTAGERVCARGYCGQRAYCDEAGQCLETGRERDQFAPPAVAASTGTSEDVETLADSIGAELYQSLMEASADVWRRWEFLTDEAKAKYRAEGGRIVNAAVAPVLAAREAAARAEVVAGVRAWCAINEIAAPPLDWEGLGEFLARVAREGRP